MEDAGKYDSVAPTDYKRVCSEVNGLLLEAMAMFAVLSHVLNCEDIDDLMATTEKDAPANNRYTLFCGIQEIFSQGMEKVDEALNTIRKVL